MELWEDIAGYEGLYQISNEGRVRSYDRIINTKDKKGVWRQKVARGHILKLGVTKTGGGYFYVQLCGNGTRKNQYVHRLVATRFINNDDKKRIFVNHKDCNSRNNHYSNLEWCSHKENMEHAAINNRMVSSSGQGEKSPAHKLTADQVAQIKERLKAGERCRDICLDYPVGSSAISEIKAGRSWSHVQAMGFKKEDKK